MKTLPLHLSIVLVILFSSSTSCGAAFRGDINDDDSLNLADTIAALQIVSGMTPDLGNTTMSVGDIDGDGFIGTAEAIYSMQAQFLPWTAEFYNNIDLTDLVMKEKVADIDGQWGSGAPLPGMGNDTFSIRWSGEFSFDGTYQFTATSDDGIRAWVGSQQIMNHWINQAPTTHTATIDLSGSQQVVVEYYENSGGAVTEFSWVEITPNCEDGIKNQDESGVDCGGVCPPCPDSCENNVLDFGEYWTDCGGICGPCPTCVDNIQNGDEEGVDCGGTCLACEATGNGEIIDIKNIPEYGYNFRMYLPPGYDNSGTFPLLLFLHGAGERGDDLNKVDNHGPLKHVNQSWWNYDFVVIAPQVPTNGWWNGTTIKKLYDTVKVTYPGIDQNRVYITGLSMGGYGVNSIMKYTGSTWVAANAEICGQVETNSSACAYKDTPSWSFACDYDPTVGYAWSISPWAKVLHGEDNDYSCGNTEPNPNIRISLFDCDSHDSWSRVYDPFQAESKYILSTERGVNSEHQFEYGEVNGAPPLYDWFLHHSK